MYIYANEKRINENAKKQARNKWFRNTTNRRRTHKINNKKSKERRKKTVWALKTWKEAILCMLIPSSGTHGNKILTHFNWSVLFLTRRQTSQVDSRCLLFAFIQKQQQKTIDFFLAHGLFFRCSSSFPYWFCWPFVSLVFASTNYRKCKPKYLAFFTVSLSCFFFRQKRNHCVFFSFEKKEEETNELLH